MPDTPQLGTEFQNLPLEALIAAPLSGAVRAQQIAAQTTLDFLQSMIETDGKVKTVDFSFAMQSMTATGQNSSQTMSIKAPLMSIVPIPHLRIDAVSVNFKYEVTQVVKETKAINGNADLKLGLSPILAKFVDVSLSGSVAGNTSSETSTNRSGTLDVTVHASEAPVPEGLERLLSLLAKAVPSVSTDVQQ